MPNRLHRFFADDSGASAIEYALVAMLIGVAVFGSLGALGASVFELYDHVQNSADRAMAETGVRP